MARPRKSPHVQVVVAILCIWTISPVSSDLADVHSSWPFLARSSTHSYSSGQSWSPGKDGKMHAHSSIHSTTEDSVNDGSKEHLAVVSMDCIDGHCQKMQRHSTAPKESSAVGGNASMPDIAAVLSPSNASIFNIFGSIPMPSLLASSTPLAAIPRSISNDSFFDDRNFGEASLLPYGFNDIGMGSESGNSPKPSHAAQKTPIEKHGLEGTAMQGDQDFPGEEAMARSIEGSISRQTDASQEREDSQKKEAVLADSDSNGHSESYTSTYSYSNVNGKKEITQKKERCKDGKCETLLRQRHV